MTLLLRDARLVEDAANGASVHNLPQVNASVLHVICVEYDSHRVKRDYNSGVAVKPITIMYMRIVSTEGLDMIMNCSQNKPQIRMQLMQSPVNGTPSPEQQRTQVLLPFAQDPDQASTAVPPDDERDLFGREEALRMDEEIMDFQWFEHVTWDSIKDLRGTTYVQPPTRFRFALQQAQHAILQAIIHNNPTSPASESTWKVLVLSSWLLLGRPAVNASESNCAHFLDARLELFWAEDWSALWAMVRAECDVAPVQNTTLRTEKQQMQSRIRKVATLARTGEKGRALAAARNAPPVPVTEQIVQEIKSLYPADPEPPAPASASISALFLSEVAEHVPTTLRKMPRLSEPGPLGMRAEHWYDFGSLAGNSDLFVQVVAHIAAAVPNSVLQYLRATQITPLAKPTGGHRPLLMMSFLRRLALKSVMAAKKESVAKCAGPLQYGVGRPDGANTMIKTIQYLAEQIIPEFLLPSTSRLHSKTSLAEPWSTALLKPMQTLQQSYPSGT